MRKWIPTFAVCLSLGALALGRGDVVSARAADPALRSADIALPGAAAAAAGADQQYPQPTLQRELPPGKAVASAASVRTDKFDYKPAETVIITGAGFEPGEPVALQVRHANGLIDGNGHVPFTTLADPSGGVADQWYVDPKDSPHAIFILTAEGLTSGRTARAIFMDAPQMVVDDSGADDYPGQKDLNFFTFDYGDSPNPTEISVAWGWDDTAWSGNNTGDACTLFDTNANGKADYSMCVTVGGTPATFQSRRLYTCGDKASDRCSQPIALIADSLLGSVGSASVVPNSDPFGVPASPDYNPAHVTGNTCSALSGCYTDDTVALLQIQLSDFGNVTPKLINVCSYPSSQPNSAPSECVITPNNGFLTIVKVADPSDTTQKFTFNLGTGQHWQDGTASWDITGSGQEQFISFAPSNTNDLSEAIPTGWNLDSAACVIQSSPTASTGSFSSPTVSNFEIKSGLETICTFTDTIQAASLTVKKVVTNDNGGTKKATDFTFTVGGTSYSFIKDGDDNHGTKTISLQPGVAYTVTEDGVPITGYDTDLSAACTSATGLSPGGSATCTITNNDQPGTLIVLKTVINDNGGTKIATDFKFIVDAGTATGFLQDGGNTLAGKNTISVDAGTHSVVEDGTPISGYTTSYSYNNTNSCSSISIANGQTKTCTITNDDAKASPGSTTAQNAVLHDTVTITGIVPGAASHNTATATFQLFKDASCLVPVAAAQTVTLSYNTTSPPTAGSVGTASTPTGFGVNKNGTYYWKVGYSGDEFNAGFAGDCGAEKVTVTFDPTQS